jgi:hypothetical protein
MSVQRVQWVVDPSDDDHNSQPPTAGEGERTAWGRVGIAICCFRTQAVRVVEFVRRELEPDDMCIRTGVLGGPRGEVAGNNNIGCSINALGRTWDLVSQKWTWLGRGGGLGCLCLRCCHQAPGRRVRGTDGHKMVSLLGNV